MKMKRFFLLGLICFFLTTNTSICSTDEKHGPDIEMGPTAMHPVQTAANIDSSSSSWSPLAKTIAGSVFSFSGYVLMGAGAVVADVTPDAKVLSGAFLGIGGAARQAGGVFFNLAQEKEAELAELDGHVARAKAGTLTADEIQELSDQYLAKNKTYQQLYLKGGLCMDSIFGNVCDLVGVPVGLIGAGFWLSGDRTVGPALIAGGAAVHDLGGWFKDRAAYLKAQKARINKIKKATPKAS